MQRSDSFILGALLSFSGGLQDAYTYNIRDRVFANAQTGNVVLMSQKFMQGNWNGGLEHLLAIISFVAGVFLSECIERKLKYGKRVHWRQIVLLVELLLLFIVGLIPRGYAMAANMAVSFSCAMQVHAFRRLRGNSYASTMCIGNLKSGTLYLARFAGNRSMRDLNTAFQYYAIIAIFALGAGVGGVLSGYLGIRTIWISCGFILMAGLILGNEKELGSSGSKSSATPVEIQKNS